MTLLETGGDVLPSAGGSSDPSSTDPVDVLVGLGLVGRFDDAAGVGLLESVDSTGRGCCDVGLGVVDGVRLGAADVDRGVDGCDEPDVDRSRLVLVSVKNCTVCTA